MRSCARIASIVWMVLALMACGDDDAAHGTSSSVENAKDEADAATKGGESGFEQGHDSGGAADTTRVPPGAAPGPDEDARAPLPAADASWGSGNLAPGPAVPPERVAMVSNFIESAGFDAISDSAVSSGPIPVPVLLYTGGYASYNANLVVKPIDIEFDVVEHPEAWPVWRRNADVIELKTNDGWKPLYYKYKCDPLPKGTTLSGTFQHVRDTAIATTAAVKTIDRYRFKSDGTFQSCKSTLTVVPAIPTIRREYQQKAGSYTIDGYKLSLTYEDGSGAVAAFFYDPARPSRIWLGRSHFPGPSNDTPEICTVP